MQDGYNDKTEYQRGYEDGMRESRAKTNSTHIAPIIVALVANAAIGAGTGWVSGWLLNQAGIHNNILYGFSMLPLMAVGLFTSIAVSEMMSKRPWLGAAFLPVFAIAMFTAA